MKISKIKIKNKYNIIYIAMITFSVLLIAGAGTYAYYQSTITGTANGTIATWNFKANNQTTTMNLDLGSMYPGKMETHNIVLSAESSELEIYYEILFTLTSPSPNGYTNWLYWDEAYVERVGRCSNHQNYPGIRGKYGVIQSGTSITIPLYYYFPYNQVQQSYISTRDQYSLTIIARQKTGTSASIPMKLNGNTYTYTAVDSTTGWIESTC